jgi:hypothetical protein
LTISGNEFVFIAMGVFTSFSRHKLLKDKFTWKSQYVLSLDYERPKSEPNSPVAPIWHNVIDVMSNRARQLLRWMCELCMKQRHSVTHAVQRSITETYGPKFLFLASIYRFECGYTLCIVHKWNLSVWSYEMSGETFWSGAWFSYKKDLKIGCKNQNWKHRPVINFNNMSICIQLFFRNEEENLLMHNCGGGFAVPLCHCGSDPEVCRKNTKRI